MAPGEGSDELGSTGIGGHLVGGAAGHVRRACGWKSNGQFKGLEIQKQSEICGERILRNLIWLHQDGRCL